MSMTEHQETLFGAVSDLDEVYVTVTPPRRKAAVLLRRIGAVAAALALMVGIAWFAGWLGGEEASHPTFVLKVQAADGGYDELMLSHAILNASHVKNNIFGVDMPLFSFDVAQTEWEAQPNRDYHFNIEISYDGKIVKGKDKHIIIGYTRPVYGTEGIASISVMGWFEEPKDLTVTVREKESGEVVQVLTVHVKYEKEEEAYQLTLTEVYSSTNVE